MAKGTIGFPFTFSVLFVDANGAPIVPLGVATIEVFYFDSDGAKQELLAPGTPMSTVLGDPGRYVRTLTIPTSLNSTLQLYGLMRAIEPGTGVELLDEQSVDLVGVDTTGECNYRTAFIKPPNFQ